MFKKPTKSTTKNTLKKIIKKNIIKNNNSDLSYIEDDKILKKVEKYVDENRAKTSKEILERKNKRPAQKYQNADLEVMISRISNESKPKEKTKEVSKRILYLIYIIIIIVILIFMIKYFFIWNIPQLS